MNCLPVYRRGEWRKTLLVCSITFALTTWGGAQSETSAPKAAASAEKPLEATLKVDPARVDPDSTIQLVFPTPMVEPERTGTLENESPLLVDPPLAGEFLWTSSRSGQFRMTEAPKFSQTYSFRLRDDLKDLNGKPLSTANLDTLSSAGFTIIDQDPKWFDQRDVPRMRPFLFQFNAAVDVNAAAEWFRFESNNPKQTVLAKVRHPQTADFKGVWAGPQPTWEEAVAKIEPELEEGVVRMNALVVEPAEPLPVAETWELVVAAQMTDTVGRSRLATERRVVIGAVLPMSVDSVTARTPFDNPYHLDVQFNKSLFEADRHHDIEQRDAAHAAAVAEAASYLEIDPAPADLKFEVFGALLRITGGFELDKPYRVTVKPGITSHDGLALAEPVVDEQVVFKPNAPYVSAPAFASAQMARGTGDFEISAANVKSVRVRAKRLSGPEFLDAMERYRPYQREFERDLKKRREFKPALIGEMPGELIFDRHFKIDKPIDQSDLIRINWREILGGAGLGSLFVEMEGIALDGLEDRAVITQSLIESTDLGALLKTSGRDHLVFVTHLLNGQPVAAANVTLLDEQRRLLAHAVTGNDGVARITGGAAAPAFALIEFGADTAVLNVQNGGTELWGVYGWDIHRSWRNVWQPARRTFVFSDRPLYRPGDTLHLKAMTRLQTGDILSLDGSEVEARIKLRDSRYRLIVDTPVKFGMDGALNTDLTLPEGPLGWYDLQIDFSPAEEGDEHEEETAGQEPGYLGFQIEEYRPNTFEVRLDPTRAEFQEDRVQIPLTAHYYMGKALSQGDVSWHAFSETTFEPPVEYRDYHFGSEPSWVDYSGTQDDSNDESWFVSGDLALSADGTANVPLPKPPPHRASLPQKVEVIAELTDLNQQTIISRTTLQVPGAPVVPGVRQIEGLCRVGQPVTLDFIALDGNASPLGDSAEVEVVIERQEHLMQKIETAGGGVSIEEQLILHEELRQPLRLRLSSGSGSAVGATLPFTPKQGGEFFVTITATGPDGSQAFSRMPFYVVGRNQFPWAIEPGVKIALQPEKIEVMPGGEAVIVVKSPIDGTALVTVERNRIHQHWVRPFTLEDPVVRVPVGDAEAPNVFISVAIVRGSAASPKQLALPELRMGYTELQVKSDALDLQVSVRPAQPEVLPGAELSVEADVLDASGVAMPGAEVTLFAVDEGVLSIVNHPTPDPAAFFHPAMPLAFSNYSSLSNLLPESPDDRVRTNKGFLIGGGGEGETALPDLRKNFVATPLWLASERTDENGRVSAKVIAPDNLTRYRLMAVVSAGAERFGRGESAFAVNKPLMIEPVVPRFARLGDEVLVKAVVHNTTKAEQKVEVNLTLDDHAEFISQARPFAVAVSLGTTPLRQTRQINVPAGGSLRTVFPVKLTALGTAKWGWTARAIGAADDPQDGIESVFEIEHPVPELREIRSFPLAAAPPAPATEPKAKPKAAVKAPETAKPAQAAPEKVNLLADFNPVLLEGAGTLQVRLTTSRLIELVDALDYLLQYPYGCAEQTTSATMPWLALGGYHALFPNHLNSDKARAAIQRGADRLLRMATGEGLAYWPGGSESNRWASAYGGLMLIRARESGARVPQEVIDEIMTYLSEGLRGLEEEKDRHVLTDAALSLYALAKAKRAEPAYQTLLFNRRETLPEAGKLYLALAMLISDTPHEQVKTLLGLGAASGKPAAAPVRDEWQHWAGSRVNDALRLIVLVHMGMTPTAHDLADKIYNSRGLRGEWGNTYTNAWTVTALAAYERSTKAKPGPAEVRLVWADGQHQLRLEPNEVQKNLMLPLSIEQAAAPLYAEWVEGDRGRLRIEARAHPRERDFPGERNGLGIEREYRKLLPDGSTAEADDLQVGDLVQVTLGIQVDSSARFLAIDDPLPGVFEAVNPEFETQNARQESRFDDYAEWFCDHRELKTDRALFFTDHAPERGRFTLRYLARVIAEGDVVAPPARIEAMYEPSKFGLSPTLRVLTVPPPPGEVAGQ